MTPSLSRPLRTFSLGQVRGEGLYDKLNSGPSFSLFCRSPRDVNTSNLFRQGKGQGETPGDTLRTNERVRDSPGKGHRSLEEADRSFPGENSKAMEEKPKAVRGEGEVEV